jgi:hypothetical protein
VLWAPKERAKWKCKTRRNPALVACQRREPEDQFHDIEIYVV